MEKTNINNTTDKIKPLKDSLKIKSGSVYPPVPERFQPLLWSKNVKNLDFKKDRIYIVHHVLAYGSIEDINFIIKTYSKEEVIDVFVNYPQKVYTRPVFLFIKNFLLKLKDELNEEDYVKGIFKSS